MEIRPVALEKRMGRDLDKDIEIARNGGVAVVLALSGQADTRAGLDSRRHLHRERAILSHLTGAGAAAAGILDDRAFAPAGRAGALDRKETLLRPILAHPGAGRTSLGLRTVLGARALAFGTIDSPRHGNCRLLAGIGLFQRDAEIVAEVRAPPCGATARAP